ncbi:MAG: nucleotidyltransferase family protein [Patescibacteria group bacterium]
MKIVILAAGKGTRLLPLTQSTPKPLLRFGGQTILDHTFKALPAAIDEAVIVINYLGEQIKDYCGASFHGRPINYVEGQTKGTGFDLLAARAFIAAGERFAIAYADEVFNADSLKKCLQHKYSWLCFPVAPERARQSGIPTLDEFGKIIGVVEKPANPATNIVLNGFMVVNSDIFSYNLVPHPNGEYYLTDLMANFIKNYDVYAVVVPEQPGLTRPEDLENLNKYY